MLLLPPAAFAPAFAQAGHAGRVGPRAGISRDAYIKADAARAASAAAKRFERIDAGHKGVIDRATYVGYYQARAKRFAGRRFDRIDTNHDGLLEPGELAVWRDAHRRRPRPAGTH